MPSLIWLIGIAALAVGIAMGWLLHVRRIGHREQVDWRTRVAARDRDLHDLREQLTRVTIELQEANARRGATDELGILEADLAAQRSRAAAAEARLSAAEVELADVRDLEIGGGASSDTDLLHRIEELEVELTALASHRCPDPGAHSSGDIGRVRPPPGHHSHPGHHG
ncbi:MAG: hypothetical protein MUP76_03430 [Acidimicrobiia bacterium]|nr:hypothetical protein [Acidimicrobiia bacterium]